MELVGVDSVLDGSRNAVDENIPNQFQISRS